MKLANNNIIIYTLIGAVLTLLVGTSLFLWWKNAFTTTYLFYLFSVTLFFALTIIFFLIKQIHYDRKLLNEETSQILEQQKALHDHQNRFEIFFREAHYGMALLNLDGRLVKVNDALCHILGYSEEDMLAMNFYYLIHPDNMNNLQINIQQLLDNKIKSYVSEQKCYRKNGETLWVNSLLTLIFDSENKPTHFLLQVQDMTMQKKTEERLQHMAYIDSLTGLANRNRVEQFIQHLLVASRRHRQQFALLMLDLDRFKNINDSLGHEAGDELLRVVADRLRNSVRSTDVIARLGGDEFIIVVTDVKKSESAAVIAQKILQNMMREIMIQEQEIYITTSIGISLYPYDGHELQILLKNADLALYRAKDQGRNNYQFYTLEMTIKAQEKLALQNTLANALVRDEFTLNYQPKMEIKTRRISGIEALLRWKNTQYVTITPIEIIALAEETGLIVPVSEWVLRTACHQLKRWHDAGLQSLTMAINCSARQFKHAIIVDDIIRITNEAGISPAFLEIEVTEKIIMQHPENTLHVLYALKDLGVQIAVDDFGTGYWSHNNLRKLAIDKIKIDKTFIKQIPTDEISASITSAIIAMANKLNIKTIAEGVETREQYEFLVHENCTEIQGYYLTRPLAEVAMTQFLNHPIPDAEAISPSEIEHQ